MFVAWHPTLLVTAVVYVGRTSPVVLRVYGFVVRLCTTAWLSYSPSFRLHKAVALVVVHLLAVAARMVVYDVAYLCGKDVLKRVFLASFVVVVVVVRHKVRRLLVHHREAGVVIRPDHKRGDKPVGHLGVVMVPFPLCVRLMRGIKKAVKDEVSFQNPLPEGKRLSQVIRLCGS